MKKIKELKKGEYFTIRPIEEPQGYQVWVRDQYDRSERRYLCHNYEDNNRWRYYQGDKEVFVDF